jgi:hypothetical protein
MTNSNGQSSTPQVRLKDIPLWPNKEKLTGCSPNNLSSEKIFVPIASAINALATKNAVKPRNNLVGLSLRMACIIEI